MRATGEQRESDREFFLRQKGDRKKTVVLQESNRLDEDVKGSTWILT